MRQSEFRKKVQDASDAELESMLSHERENLYMLRQKVALKQLTNPHAISEGKKNVARILLEKSMRETKVGGRS